MRLRLRGSTIFHIEPEQRLRLFALLGGPHPPRQFALLFRLPIAVVWLITKPYCCICSWLFCDLSCALPAAAAPPPGVHLISLVPQVDHASQAYNRAALYMNGPETPLNPTKAGYLPPPLTGRSVRVPRNKLFVQQLPLPLIAQAQVCRPGGGLIQTNPKPGTFL